MLAVEDGDRPDQSVRDACEFFASGYRKWFDRTCPTRA